MSGRFCDRFVWQIRTIGFCNRFFVGEITAKLMTRLVCLLRLVCGGGHVKWCHEVAKAVRIVIFKLFVASCCDFTHEANIIDT